MSNQAKKYLNALFIFSLAIFWIAGCNLRTSPTQQGPTPTPQTILATISPNATPTPTPYRPSALRPTPDKPIFPTATPVGQIADTEVDGTDSNASNPQFSGSPAPLIQQPKNQINILILGSDKRPYEGGFRTDVILMVTVNFDKQTINLTSFPRDLYVYLPGLYSDRINSAQFRGGFELMADTFEYNFGVRPDYYAMLNFYGFEDIINTLGGVDVQVAQTLTDHRDGYGNYTISPGTVHMNGDTALWYVRARYTTSDFDRTRRQQEVLQAVMNRLISFDLVTKFPELFDHFQSTVETNIPWEEIAPLLPLADDFYNGDIGRYAVGRGEVTPWVTSSGAQVLLPNTAAIQSILKASLNAQ